MRRRLVALILLALTGWSPSFAEAYHTQQEPRTFRTAYARRQGEFRLGLQQIDYGIVDQLTLGTYVLPWFGFLALEDFVANFYLKSNYFRNEHWALSLQSDFHYIGLQNIDDEAGGRAILVPVSAAASYRIHRFTLSLEAIYAAAFSAGKYADGSNAVQSAAVANTFTVSQTVEFRISKVLAVTLLTRIAPVQTIGNVTTAVEVPPATTATLDARAELETVDFPFSLTPALELSWKHLNIRLGLQYGNFFLLGLNLPLAERRLLPSGTVYGRW